MILSFVLLKINFLRVVSLNAIIYFKSEIAFLSFHLSTEFLSKSCLAFLLLSLALSIILDTEGDPPKAKDKSVTEVAAVYGLVASVPLMMDY